MTKLVALFTHPDLPAEFDRRFYDGYLPLLRRLQGVQEVVTYRIGGTPLGEAPYYLLLELFFADRATMDSALSSDTYRKARAALANDETLATYLFAEEG